MSVSLLLRRLHLYLGLGLLPWFFIYGVSSIPFAHNRFFQERDQAKGVPLFNLLHEQPLNRPVPADPDELRDFGRRLLEEVGVSGANFGVYRLNPNTVHINSYSFRHFTRVVCRIDQNDVRVEARRFRVDQFLTGLHARGGFAQDGWLQDSWGVVVDLVCLGIVLWIITGFHMWWGVPGHRLWGWLTILAGAGSFVIFTLRL